MFIIVFLNGLDQTTQNGVDPHSGLRSDRYVQSGQTLSNYLKRGNCLRLKLYKIHQKFVDTNSTTWC